MAAAPMAGDHDVGFTSRLDSGSTRSTRREKAFTVLTHHPPILPGQAHLVAHTDLPCQIDGPCGEIRIHEVVSDGVGEEPMDALVGDPPVRSPPSPRRHAAASLVFGKSGRGGIKFFPPRVHGSRMLHLAFVESALERVPPRLWSHPSVRHQARAVGKPPGCLLLDRSYHHQAMRRLSNAAKRGRPDILHVSLLAAFGTPLNREGLLRTYVHTLDDHLLHFHPEVRLPKNYPRFVGLMEQLYEQGTLPVAGPLLMTVERGQFETLLDEVHPSHVIAFSRRGRPTLLPEVLERHKDEALMVVVGAFPHGHFSEPLERRVDELIAIDKDPLEAWIVASRILYEYERLIGLPEKRLPD